MDYTLNLTQHSATPEQIAAGVVDVPDDKKGYLVALLTFDTLPTPKGLEDRARLVVELVRDVVKSHAHGPLITRVMLGGAPFFMAPLERAVDETGLESVYAFSRRESVDQPQADGSVRKVAVFRHAGFVRTIAE